VAKLIGILENRQVVKAMRYLYPDDSPPLVPDDVGGELTLVPPLSR
jgi:hypothetical protein